MRIPNLASRPRPKMAKRELTAEVLESRLNLSVMAGVSAPAATEHLRAARIVGSASTKTPMSVGATALGSGTTSISVASYSAISNSGLETQPGQTPDIGFVKTTGSYVEYTVTATTAGSYSISLGLASYSGAAVQVLVNGAAQGTVTAAATNSWSVYYSGSTTIQLATGTNVIRLASQNGTQYNINSVVLDSSGTVALPSGPSTQVGDSTTVNVTTYSSIWHMGLEYQNGKPDIGFVSANGAYVEYTIDVVTAGTYTLTTGFADVATTLCGRSLP